MKNMTQTDDDSTPTLVKIDLSKCEPHPLVKNIRFDYTEDIEKLCELIHLNGQKVPVIVVPVPGREGYYWVVMGNRRLLACKLSSEKYGEPQTLLAIVIKTDHQSDQDVVIDAYVENLSGESGGRKDLCFLEEASSLRDMIARFKNGKFVQSFAERTNTTEEAVSRKVELIKALDATKVANLHKIERHYGFYFTAEHIESFLSHRLKDDEEMYRVAALCAEQKSPHSFIDGFVCALRNGTIGGPDWLREMLPDMEPEEETLEKEKEEPFSSSTATSPFLKDANIVSCYKCGFTNPFEPTLKGGVNFVNPPDPTHKEAIEPISIIFPPKVCWYCRARFSTKISMGKNGNRIVTSIPPVEEENDGVDSRRGVLDYVRDAPECKKGCEICHLVLATKEGRFKLDHATGLFTVRIE